MIIKYDILGSSISGISLSETLELIKSTDLEIPEYICFSNVHTIISARSDKTLLDANNNSWLSLADGMPVACLGNILYPNKITRIAGHKFLWELVNLSGSSLTHFFYGSTNETVKKIESILMPILGDRLKGVHSPPFRSLTENELKEHFDNMNNLKPDIIWIGLGAPKQEIFMHMNLHKLNHGVMVGVGAAFNYLAGEIKRAPLWMQKLGLEWFYRLWQEPGRLWKRYLITNTKFIFLSLREIINYYVKKLR